jgi:hypothetical protein
MGLGKRFADVSMSKIYLLENRLSGALKPVTPRREFVNRLGQRIHAGDRPTFVTNVTNWSVVALWVAGMASVAVILAVVGRLLYIDAEKKRSA